LKADPVPPIRDCDARCPIGSVGLGELFVVRNAGYVADTAAMGTIEYAAEHLGSPLVVVLGHQRCGAVQAACEVVAKHTKLPGFIAPMVEAIMPAAKVVYGKPGAKKMGGSCALSARLCGSKPILFCRQRFCTVISIISHFAGRSFLLWIRLGTGNRLA
jgi:Carbonic anhydrase